MILYERRLLINADFIFLSSKIVTSNKFFLDLDLTVIIQLLIMQAIKCVLVGDRYDKIIKYA